MINRIANRDARKYVYQTIAFKANNLMAEWDDDNEGANTPYVVYSYGRHFPLFIYLGNTWYENKDKYSTSTSRHKSQCHPGLDTIKLTTDEMQELLVNNTLERIENS